MRWWTDTAGASQDLSDLDWYVGFGYFKLAVIAEGIHHRFLLGKTVGAGFSHFGTGGTAPARHRPALLAARAPRRLDGLPAR